MSLNFGVNLSAEGPGDSALNRFMPPEPNNGRTVMVKTMTPIPPNHCVVDLQINKDLSTESISVNIELPVVVKPETVSNKIFI